MKFVGLDIGKTWIFTCILNAQGKVVKEFKVRNDGVAINERLRRLQGPVSVCFEASCGYGHLYDQLCQIAKHVKVAHPGHLRLIFKSKRKNDRVDAKKLAKLLYLDEVPVIHVPSSNVRDWRRMVEFRNRLVRERTRLKNRLRALCRSHGIALLAGKRLWTKKGIQGLAKLQFEQNSAALERDMTLDALAHSETQIKCVEKELNEIAGRHSGVQLLQTIPGIGPRTAEAFVAYVDQPKRFRKIKQIGAYFGMVPCQDQTGDRNRLGHITREGPPIVRRLITEAAWQGTWRSPRIRERFERFCKGDPKNRKIALVATAHYLMRVMLAMLRCGEVWNENGGAFDRMKTA